MSQFQVRKDKLTATRLVETPSAGAGTDLGEGEILARIDRFSFTSNNVTYAVAGDRLGYWQFFPPTGAQADRWGIIPVWGFADVVASRLKEIPVGDRLFGYFPTANDLLLTPVKVKPAQFIDGAGHRARLPVGYNTYRRVKAEPGYDAATDNERMLLFPLHVTSFCLADALSSNAYFGARQIVMLSASSKTSIGLAYGLSADQGAPPVVAVTSARNAGFVDSLGIYRRVVGYDKLTQIDATVPTVIVDMSGNGRAIGELHRHLQANMIRTINVGLTHWDSSLKDPGIITERCEFFFAPSHIQSRIAEWGAGGFMRNSTAYMHEVAVKCRSWLKITPVHGLAGLAEVFGKVVEGQIPPEKGIIVLL